MPQVLLMLDLPVSKKAIDKYISDAPKGVKRTVGSYLAYWYEEELLIVLKAGDETFGVVFEDILESNPALENLDLEALL